MYSKSERIGPGDSLLIIADTSTLWVAADLRERDWNALTLKTGDEIRVLTSIPGMESLNAVVHFIGREVNPMTNAVPLVATIDNNGGKLRPGMFVRVAVPSAVARETLTVPESSVLEHDHQAFVFTPESDNRFRRVDIQPGLRTGGQVGLRLLWGRFSWPAGPGFVNCWPFGPKHNNSAFGPNPIIFCSRGTATAIRLGCGLIPR